MFNNKYGKTRMQHFFLCGSKSKMSKDLSKNEKYRNVKNQSTNGQNKGKNFLFPIFKINCISKKVGKSYLA